jgi:glyoxylase-like metal-dependent hydrolase (beta-lactamase superfamily II)
MHAQVKILQTVTGEYRVNTYIVYCTDSREGVIIDPGGDAEKILRLVRDHAVKVRYILNTHGHADHILANRELKESLQAPSAMHADDAEFYGRPEIREIAGRELGVTASGTVDRVLHDGDRLRVGCMDILVLHTPGHTPGSSCFLVEGNLFTGDTLFVGDVGRTDLTGGSLDRLLQSLKEKIIGLPGETVVRPGHDYGETPTSTLAWEMRENPYITDFILADNGD